MEAALDGPFGRTPLEPTVLTIGSSPDNAVVVTSANVSEHQAEIRPEAQGYSITNLGSSHGTFVNGQPLNWNTSRQLNPGDTITIGDTAYTYVVESAPRPQAVPGLPVPPSSPLAHQTGFQQEALHPPPEARPLPYRGESIDSQFGVAPPVESLLPASGAYEAGILQEDEARAVTHPTDLLPFQQQPGMQPEYPGSMPASVAPAQPPAAQPRTKRRAVWIALAALLIAVLILAGIAVFYVVRSTPEKTLDAYCNALQAQDYRTAYNQLALSLQSTQPEAQFALQDKLTTCTHSSANINGNHATASVTLVAISGQTTNDIVTLTLESGNTWKISVIPPPLTSSPKRTLTVFCNALKKGDFQTAYNQLSTGIQTQVAESDFAVTQQQSIIQAGGIKSCTVSNINESDSSASGTITYNAGNGHMYVKDAGLIDENGVWKINR